MKHLKKFESFVEQITDDKINDFLNYKWNPNDPQIYRSHDVPDNIEVGDILIHRVDKSKDRFLKGTMSELVDILPSWQNFTNRKKSTVATNNFDYAKKWSVFKGVYITILHHL